VFFVEPQGDNWFPWLFHLLKPVCISSSIFNAYIFFASFWPLTFCCLIFLSGSRIISNLASLVNYDCKTYFAIWTYVNAMYLQALGFRMWKSLRGYYLACHKKLYSEEYSPLS
jgi:hypothetical protein